MRRRKSYKPSLLALGMVKSIQAQDAENYLFLTAGNIADEETLAQLAPRIPIMLRSRSPPSAPKELVMARALDGACRRRHWYRKYRDVGGQVVLDLDLHTWVIGDHQGDEAALRAFFPETREQDHRLIIHRTPACYEGRPVAPAWAELYAGRVKPLRSRSHFTERERTVGAHYLQTVLKAYQEGNDEAKRVFDMNGHTYWFFGGARSLGSR